MSTTPQIRVIVQNLDGTTFRSYSMTKGEYMAEGCDGIGSSVIEDVSELMQTLPDPEPASAT